MSELSVWAPPGTSVSMFITQSGKQGMIFIGEGAVTNTSLRACPHCHVSFKTGAHGVVVRLDKSLAFPESQGLFCPACNQEISQQQFLEGEKTGPGASSGADNCFIATAAFGSGLEPQAQTLRVFRDEHLARRFTGRAVIYVYEWLGPYLASIVRRSEALRVLVRHVLTRVARHIEQREKEKPYGLV